MAAVVKTSYYLLAILSAALGDRTLNRPGCAEIAFSGESKYLACSYTSGADTLSSCEGYNASSAVALGGTVVWTLNDYKRESFSVSTDNFTSTHSMRLRGSTPFVNISADTGELYIDMVSSIMRETMRTIFNCSILDSEGRLCGIAMNEIIISIPEDSVRGSPVIHSLPNNEALIGRGTSICLEGTIGGTNGSNFWTFNDSIIVNATDITNLTNPGNSNFLDFTPAICETCSCVEKYSAIPAVESMLSENLQETGFASFIVTMFVTSDTDDVGIRNRLCYGLPNRFITVLMVEEVKRDSQGPLEVEITLTSAWPMRLRRSIDLQAYYYQPTREIDFQLFPSHEVVLGRGDRTVILCNATAAGNSTAQLYWRTGDDSRPVVSQSPGLLSVSNTTEDFLREVCVEGPGVFSVSLPGELGPSSDLAFPGAIVLNLYSVLVLCEAQPSFSGAYICFANSSQQEFRSVLTVSVPHVNILPYAVATPVVILVLTVCLIVLIVWCAVRHYHSKRFDPLLMNPHLNLPPARLSCTNFTFDMLYSETPEQPFAENTSSLEFSRDRLHLISVLGEGQFGQVWKAMAVGICPQDANRSIVAVKTLKPNASRWDKQEMHSELEIMQGMPPHLNIINYLGMCSETDTEPLLILMEFAMHGSLKDYLKKLTSERTNPVRSENMRRLGQRAGGGRCVCPCHYAGQEAGRQQGIAGRGVAGQQQGIAGRGVTGQGAAGRQQGVTGDARRPSNVGSNSLYQCDPAVMAHAARLMRLLDNEYCSHENEDGESVSHSEGHVDAGAVGTVAETEGMCAYHLHVDDIYYNYREHSGYYNHGGGVAGGGANGEEEAETPGSHVALLSYENVEEESSCHCSSEESCHCSSVMGSCECVSEGSDPTSLPEEGYYHNLPSGCIYCSEGVEQEAVGPGAAGDGAVCMCPDLSVMEGKLSYFELLDFAHQIARGMEHLEKMKCVHRDLAARNVLIAEGFLLKIGDFGLSRTLAWKDYYRKVSPGKIPARWMAKESLEERIHTSKSDVWSYGVLLWEVLTYGDLPYGRTPMASSIDTLAAYLSSGHRLPQPVACNAQTYELLLKCWDDSPDKRPSFQQLAEIFDALLAQSPDHLNTTVEAAAVHPEVTALEARVFAQVCPLFEPPECSDLCSECEPCADIPEDCGSPPRLLLQEGRDSGLELAEGEGGRVSGESPTCQGAYVPPNEVMVPPHKVLKAVESGVSSDGSYLTLHEPCSSDPSPLVGSITSTKATPTCNTESACLPQQQAYGLVEQQNLTQQKPAMSHHLYGRSHDPSQGSHDPSRGSHDRRIVTTQTRMLWRKTDSIETDV